jgi:UDP-glucose 4-epimerase
VIAVLGSAMVKGQPLVMYRDGAAACDYVYVDAFVCAGCAAFDTIGTYDVGTGQYTSPTEVHGLMAAVLDGASLPSPAEEAGDELRTIALNATETANELDWRPTVDLAEGIRRSMRWLCDTLESEATELVGA